MSLLSELKIVIEGIGLPVETGVFSDEPPEEYVWSRRLRIPMNFMRITCRNTRPRRRGSPCSPGAII